MHGIPYRIKSGENSKQPKLTIPIYILIGIVVSIHIRIIVPCTTLAVKQWIRTDEAAKIGAVQTSVDLRSSLLTLGKAQTSLALLSLNRNLGVYQAEHPQVFMMQVICSFSKRIRLTDIFSASHFFIYTNVL